MSYKNSKTSSSSILSTIAAHSLHVLWNHLSWIRANKPSKSHLCVEQMYSRARLVWQLQGFARANLLSRAAITASSEDISCLCCAQLSTQHAKPRLLKTSQVFSFCSHVAEVLAPRHWWRGRFTCSAGPLPILPFILVLQACRELPGCQSG